MLAWHFEKVEVKCIFDAIERQKSPTVLASQKQQWLVALKNYATCICSSFFSDMFRMLQTENIAAIGDIGKEIALLKDRKLIPSCRH